MARESQVAKNIVRLINPFIEKNDALIAKINSLDDLNLCLYAIEDTLPQIIRVRNIEAIEFLFNKGFEIANKLKADFMVLDGERDTGRVIFTDSDGTRTFLDFATYRGSNLDEDLRARDFTINAIAYDPLDHRLHDPFGGQIDLTRRVVRAVGEAEAGVEFGSVEPERFDLDQHLTRAREWQRKATRFQHLWPTGLFDFNGSHRGGQGHL